jgi:ABC-type molybdate transport system permease subunit
MGPGGYAIVIVLLGAWFAWLMSRMAPYAPGGIEMLVTLGLALGAVVIVPALLLALGRGVDRLNSRGH